MFDNLTPIFSDIIEAGSFQQSDKDTARCKAIGAVVELFVAVGVGAAGNVLGGAVLPLKDMTKTLSKLAKTMSDESKDALGLARSVNAAIEAQLAQTFLNREGPHGKLLQQWLTTSVSQDPFCQTFSGDYPDLKGKNTQALVKVATAELQEIANAIAEGFFDNFYNGGGSDENGHTATSLMMRRTQWTHGAGGRESLVDSLNKAVDPQVECVSRHDYSTSHQIIANFRTEK